MRTNESRGRLLILEIRPPRLLSLSMDGADLRVLIDDLGGTPDGIQVDQRSGHIYWTNMGQDFNAPDGTIERCDLDGSHRTVLIGGGKIVTPKQLALAGDHLYWCDREGMAVMRARCDGEGVEALVRRGSAADSADEMRHCVGIAVDEASGHVYWTQKGPDNGGRGRIFRAPLQLPAGATPEDRADIELLLDGLPEPIDLEFDPEAGMLYWTDRGAPPDGNSLNRARVTEAGLTDHEIIARGFEEGIGLALDLSVRVAYVTDLGGKVRRIELDGGASEVLRVFGPLTGLVRCASTG
jgi:sugar lactone lactonase YvrE